MLSLDSQGVEPISLSLNAFRGMPPGQEEVIRPSLNAYVELLAERYPASFSSNPRAEVIIRLPETEWLGLADRYSFPVLEQRHIDAIVDRAPIIEMGAGTGWIKEQCEIRARARGVHDFEMRSFDNCPNPCWQAVVAEGDPQDIAYYPGRTLLLSWPPTMPGTVEGSDMAERALREFLDIGGEELVYIGEERSATGERCGRTATPAFWDLVERNFDPQPLVLPLRIHFDVIRFDHYGAQEDPCPYRDHLYIFSRPDTGRTRCQGSGF